jgi:formylglycine-generating enzyme required for sulfatase activity
MIKRSIPILLVLFVLSALSAEPQLQKIKGGTFYLGADQASDVTGREVKVSAFKLARYEVTVDEFREFVEDTGYVTTAEDAGYGFGYKDGSWDYYEGLSWRDPGFDQSGDHPVSCLSWYDAVSYCNWLSVQEGLKPAYIIDEDFLDPNNLNSADPYQWTVTWNKKANGYRLPTEAEWEYAARNRGKGIAYPWGDSADPWDGETALANIADESFAGLESYDDYDYEDYYDDSYDDEYDEYGDEYEDSEDDDYEDLDYDDIDDTEDDSYMSGEFDDGWAFTSPVGIFPANDLGIFDMGGNVSELCWDWYSEDYPNVDEGSNVNLRGPESGAVHSHRGSAWCDGSEELLINYRRSVNTDYLSYVYYGIRLAR